MKKIVLLIVLSLALSGAFAQSVIVIDDGAGVTKITFRAGSDIDRVTNQDVTTLFIDKENVISIDVSTCGKDERLEDVGGAIIMVAEGQVTVTIASDAEIIII
jgi:hypothetical protein